MAEGQVPAGWYPDPAGDTSKIRYWDGQGWTEQTQPAFNPELQTAVGSPTAPQPVYASGQVIQDYSPEPIKDRKGFAVAALVFGIISIIGCCFTWIDMIFGVLAVVFGALGIKSSKKTMSIIGLVLGVIGLILAVIAVFLITDMVADPTKYGFPADTFNSIRR